jgi:hypothetical protein
MNKSEFLELNLPSRDNPTDSADINQISENFATIDKAFLDLVEKELPKLQTKENMTTAFGDETSDENLYPSAKAVVNYVKPIKNNIENEIKELQTKENMVSEFSDKSADTTKYPNVPSVVNYTNDKIDPFKIVNTAKGNSIVLKDSSNLPFENLKLFGKTEQDERFFKNALPTPTFGTQYFRNVLISNLHDGRVQLSGTSVTDDEVFTIADNVVLSSLKVGGRYRWHCKNAEANNVDVAVTLSWVKNGVSMTKELVSNEDEFIAEASSIKATVQMLMDNVAYDCIVTPEIYLAEAPLVSVGDSGSYEVGVYGKNLIDLNSCKPIASEKITINGDSITIGAGSNIYGVYWENLPLKVGETYTFGYGSLQGLDVFTYGYRLGFADGTYSSGYLSSTQNILTIPKPVKNVLFYIGSNRTTTTDVTISKFQVELGSQATPYEPYKAKQSMTFTDTLRGIGDIKDEVDFARGVKIQRFEKFVFNGSENWTYNGSNQGYGLALNNVGGYANGGMIANIIADKLKATEQRNIYNGSATNSIAANGGSSSKIYIRIDETLTTVELFKSWLASNPVTCICELITPIETPLTEQELNAYRQLHTNKPNTTIISEADMEIDYVAGTKLYIDNKIAELTALTLEG